MKKFQIVLDSSSDLTSSHFNDENILLSIVPLTIHVDDKEFVDEEGLDTEKMLEEIHAFKGKSTSSCPPVGLFEETFDKAENTICITLSSGVSGTYNSARLAAEAAKEKGRNVYVVDSKSTNGCLVLAAEKCYELMKQDLPFEEIITKIEEYTKSLTLLFILRDFSNLIKNGRMSKISGMIAGALKITPIASPIDGDIKLVEKKRTPIAAIKRLVEMIGEKLEATEGKEIIISHCFDLETANYIKDLVKEKYNFKRIRIMATGGLASFYALEKGILVSF